MTDERCLALVDLSDGPLRCAKNLGHDDGHTAYDGYRVITWMPQRLTVAGLRQPLYINHERGTPEWGDVIRSADPADEDDASVWIRVADHSGAPRWMGVTSGGEQVWADSESSPAHFPRRLLLLVDGETGKAVRSEDRRAGQRVHRTTQEEQ